MPELSPTTIAICKATAPVLAEHGVTITSRFYDILFRDYPQTKNIFNMSHQKRGDEPGQQPKSLAAAVHAYAANIDNLAALLPAVERIAQKHVSLDVGAELYPVVGTVLIQAIKEILGEAATEDIVNAWVEAYEFLADLFIEREKVIRVELLKRSGGYSTWRKMVVAKTEVESSEVTSFYLKPEDGGALPPFEPGQYLSFRVQAPGVDHACCRNYSLSNAPGSEMYRVSIKKEKAGATDAGIVSNYFHDQVKVGSVLDVGPPAGHCTLDTSSTKPLVLIGGGIGVTPLISMLQSVVEKGDARKVSYVHYARTPEVAAFKQWVDDLASSQDHVSSFAFYTSCEASACDKLGLKSTKVSASKFDASKLTQLVTDKDCEVHVIGPEALMLAVHRALVEHGVPSSQIHYEFFGSESTFDSGAKCPMH